MSNFKKAVLFFGLALSILIMLHFFLSPIPFYLFAIPILIFIAFVVHGAARIDSNFFVKAICRGTTEDKIIALTFDDGPDPINTPLLLDFLKENEMLATFFCIGKKIEGNESLLKRIDRAGHLIGNHSFSHSKFFDFFLSKKIQAELSLTQLKIQNSIAKKVRFFRPPYGVTNPHISDAVQKGNYQVIGWNIRTMDTLIMEEEKILAKIKKQLQPGSILLFHDTKPIALKVLKELLVYLKEEGYRVIRLDDLIGERAYH